MQKNEKYQGIQTCQSKNYQVLKNRKIPCHTNLSGVKRYTCRYYGLPFEKWLYYILQSSDLDEKLFIIFCRLLTCFHLFQITSSGALSECQKFGSRSRRTLCYALCLL